MLVAVRLRAKITVIVFGFRFCLAEPKVKLDKTVHVFVMVPTLHGQTVRRSHSPDCFPTLSGLSKKKSSMDAVLVLSLKQAPPVCLQV